MEASTRMPKSMAPMEMRFADWLVRTMRLKAKRTAKGMVMAAMRGDAPVAEHGEQHQRDQGEAHDDDVRTVAVVMLMRVVRS